MPLSVVILAAGQGKRMHSDLPKVLQPLAGRPLLQHVIDTTRRLGAGNTFVVYGHGGAEVQAALPVKKSTGCCRPSSWVRVTRSCRRCR